MTKVLCCSVRVKEIKDISDKAVLIVSYNGKEDVIPKSQIYGFDNSAQKSEAVWIAKWILEKKNLQYSKKKEMWIDTETGKHSKTSVKHHIPKKKTNNVKHDNDLFR